MIHLYHKNENYSPEPFSYRCDFLAAVSIKDDNVGTHILGEASIDDLKVAKRRLQRLLKDVSHFMVMREEEECQN